MDYASEFRELAKWYQREALAAPTAAQSLDALNKDEETGNLINKAFAAGVLRVDGLATLVAFHAGQSNEHLWPQSPTVARCSSNLFSDAVALVANHIDVHIYPKLSVLLAVPMNGIEADSESDDAWRRFREDDFRAKAKALGTIADWCDSPEITRIMRKRELAEAMDCDERTAERRLGASLTGRGKDWQVNLTLCDSSYAAMIRQYLTIHPMRRLSRGSKARK